MTRNTLIICGVLLLLGGCAESHLRDVDAGPVAEAPVTTVDAGEDEPPASPTEPASGALCGPNRCLAGEICCNEECGVCAFPDECVDHGCLDP